MSKICELELEMQIRLPVLDIPLCESGNRLSSLQKECNSKEEDERAAQKTVIETLTAEEEFDICSSRRRRNGGIHVRAPSELLIAESSNSPRLAALHYSHFIQQLLLPPPITNTHSHTHIFTSTHTRTHIFSTTTMHFTACTTQLPAGSQFNIMMR